MEIIATKQEVDSLLVRYPLKSDLLFPEDRKYPIRMADYLPLRWIGSGPSEEFRGEAARGEFYTFQIGVYAARTAIRHRQQRLPGCNGQPQRSTFDNRRHDPASLFACQASTAMIGWGGRWAEASGWAWQSAPAVVRCSDTDDCPQVITRG